MSKKSRNGTKNSTKASSPQCNGGKAAAAGGGFNGTWNPILKALNSIERGVEEEEDGEETLVISSSTSSSSSHPPPPKSQGSSPRSNRSRRNSHGSNKAPNTPTHHSFPSNRGLSLPPSATSSPSRIPLYLKNGTRPHHSPLHQLLSSPSSSQVNGSCGIHGPRAKLLPERISQRHFHHLHHHHHHHNNVNLSSSPSREGAGLSGSNTPVNRTPSRRPSASIANSRLSANGSCPSPSSSHTHNHSHTNTGNRTSTPSEGMPFEEYMPLCQLQKGLQRGDVVEGILRINPKNFEDAYISAPGEEMDIYVAGVIDRNRSFNGHKVAVQLYPGHKWKIWYDKLKTNWNVYKDEFFRATSVTDEARGDVLPIDGDAYSEVAGKHEPNEDEKENFDAVDLRNDEEAVFTFSKMSEALANVSGPEIDPEPIPSSLQEMGHEIEQPVVPETGSPKKRKRKRKHNKSSNMSDIPCDKTGEEGNSKRETVVKDKNLVHESSSTSRGAIREKPVDVIPADSQDDMTLEDLLITHEGIDKVALKKSKKKMKKQQRKQEMQLQRQEEKAQREQQKSEQKQAKRLSKKPVESKVKTNHNNHKRRHENDVDGLPRSLLQLSPSELLLNYSFGKYCVQKTGKVVGIMSQNHPRVAGGKITILPDNPYFVKFNPSDSRVPRVLVPTDTLSQGFLQQFKLYQDALFMVKVCDWPASSNLPFGRLTAHLGEVGTIEAESMAILLENEVDDQPFSDEVEMDLENKYPTFIIDSEEWARRREFTDVCVFTIDPLTARDLDDALSIKPLNEFHEDKQLFEVGVHIADVSFFVEEGTELDRVAQHRSTSYYLVERMIPMLPRILCERLCSLTSGQDKMTFSVVWKMDLEGRIYDTWFGRTIIRSCAQLAYEHVQDMIDCEKEGKRWELPKVGFPCIHGNWAPNDLCVAAMKLSQMAKCMRQQRFDDGALTLSKIKFNFVLDDESGLPSGFSTGLQTDANHLVEEFMLQANRSVGEKILEVFPEQAFLRLHPAPEDNKLRELKNFCQNNDIKCDFSTAGSTQKFMNTMREADPMIHQVLSLLLLRSMKNAQYFCAGTVESHSYRHYALNIPVYTHFTSPIRRYPDVVVHRMLSAALGERQPLFLTSGQLQTVSDHCNARKTASRMVSESSQKLFLCLFIRDMKPVEEAVVTNVLDRSFDVLVLKYGVPARVYLDQLDVKKASYSCNSGKKLLSFTLGSGKDAIHRDIAVSSLVKVRLDVNVKEITKIKASLIV